MVGDSLESPVVDAVRHQRDQAGMCAAGFAPGYRATGSPPPHPGSFAAVDVIRNRQNSAAQVSGLRAASRSAAVDHFLDPGDTDIDRPSFRAGRLISHWQISASMPSSAGQPAIRGQQWWPPATSTARQRQTPQRFSWWQSSPPMRQATGRIDQFRPHMVSMRLVVTLRSQGWPGTPER